MYILDSNVIIDASKGVISIQDIINEYRNKKKQYLTENSTPETTKAPDTKQPEQAQVQQPTTTKSTVTDTKQQPHHTTASSLIDEV